ncbi:energy transducer TonB [Marivirga salinae]|uniref:Energy transducer TonB n=1 Tax=Marivirga salinarum TaxID=3059078 RepID=A0AA51NE12_9BACT|nr:energy transducer TonB [Marivirga sp. BDSF4-3]WMN12176.1 energy transducer TonB [Marivirga sp. BDSF4-3]
MKSQYQNIEDLPSLSNDDIAKHKNFKNILDKRTEHIQKNLETRKKLLKVGIFSAIIGAITIGLIYWKGLFLQKAETGAVEINNVENAISSKEAQKLEFPKAESDKGIKKNEKEVPNPSTKASKQPKNNENDIENKQTQNSERPSFQMGYEKAFPTVGMDSLSNYFNKQLKYPEKVDKKQGIEGTVNVIFTITKEGDASKIEIQNSLGEAFDEECIRLISNMPQWEPAVRNGKAVDSKVSLQLSFNIEK